MLNDFLFFYRNSVISTNIEIKEIREKLDTNKSIALIANHQTNGKGRSGNSWFSKKGDLTCSYLINNKIEVKKIGQVNIVITVAIIDALKSIFSDLDIKLKWPNDLFLNNKKLGGILLESQVYMNFINYFIIGFGLNIISAPSVSNYKTTKLLEYGLKPEPREIFIKIANFILNYLNNWKKSGFLFFKNRWLDCSKDIGKSIKIKKSGKFFTGKFLTIDDNGQLVMKINNNTLSFSFGEIT